MALLSSLTTSFCPFNSVHLQPNNFFLIVTNTKQLSRACCSCLFLGSVQVPDSCSRSRRSENRQLALCPYPVDGAPPWEAGTKGTVSKDTSPGRSPGIFLCFIVCFRGHLFLFGRVFLNFLAYFIRKCFVLTWEQIVLTRWTKLSCKDLAVFTPCSPAWGHCRQMIVLLSESEEREWVHFQVTISTSLWVFF